MRQRALMNAGAALRRHDRVWIVGIALRDGVSGCDYHRHCEERSDEAIQKLWRGLDCFAWLAVTRVQSRPLGNNSAHPFNTIGQARVPQVNPPAPPRSDRS